MSKNSFMAVQMSLGLPLSQSAFLIAAAVWTNARSSNTSTVTLVFTSAHGKPFSNNVRLENEVVARRVFAFKKRWRA
jgi:hypothetical protein